MIMKFQLFEKSCRSFFGEVRLWASWLLEPPVLRKVKMVAITQATFGIGIAAVLIGGAAALADEQAGDLPTIQVIKKVKDTYASMVTYSDEGCVVIAMGESSVINFSTRLARTNFYLVEWTRMDDPRYSATSGRSQVVWSSGAGDFLQAEAGVQSQGNREIALAHASAYSGGMTAIVPRLFFNQPREGEPIDDLVFSVTRQADEKVGEINCYVFTKGAMGATNTFWVGKQDFLIHQARMVANLESMPAFTATETHTNIVLNRSFSRSDFVPLLPLFQSPED